MRACTAVFTTLLISVGAHAAAKDEPANQDFGFATVNDTLAFLKAKPSVSFATTKPDGWLIANDSKPFAIWSFTPEGHYAYPAVVKREVKQNAQGGVFIQMTALCEATKDACDRLIGEFQKLNGQAKEDVQKHLKD
jgi:hypothetical protein